MLSDNVNDVSGEMKLLESLCSADKHTDEPRRRKLHQYDLSNSCMEAEHSISLDMLSEELERQTRQTQMLQEEVEKATRQTLERMGHVQNNTKLPISQTSSGASVGSSEYAISKQLPLPRPITSDVDVNIVRCLNFPGKDVLEEAVKEYSQQVSDLQRQLREMYDLHEQQKFNFRQTVIQLETKLHESQIEKNALQDLRIKESKKQAELTRQRQDALLELDSLKQSGQQKLMEAEERSDAFNRRSQTLEQMLQDMFTTLSQYEKHRGKSSYFCCDGTFSPSKFPLGPAVEKVLQDLEKENCGLQEKLKLMERQLKDLEKEGQTRSESLLKEQNKKMEQLTTAHDQEMVLLTEKLRSSEDNAASLKLQVELLQEQVESQTSHQSQVKNLESALSTLRSEILKKQQSHEAKVIALEEALAQAQFQAEQAQRERELAQQQAEELDVQLCQLTMSANTEQEEAWNKLEQLCNEIQQLQQAKNEAMQLHKQSSREAERLQVVLDEQEKEMQFHKQEEQPRAQALQAEVEVLRMKLQEWENSKKLLRKPLETQEEKSSLAIQLEQLSLDNQHLKCALQEAEVRLSAVEKEKIQQQTVLSERASSLHQLTLEKQQMAAELEEQCKRLSELQEEQEALREQHSRKIEELQEQNIKLKAQLNNTGSSLQKAKRILQALEGADGHGLKVALGMQKQITAKREQIDFLQSRVQMLEETTEKLALEKRYQVMERKHHVQELQFEKESRRRLETDLDTLRTNEKLLKSKADRLDTALHKMSDSFAECQEFIQKQEQEIMRIKLQHALEVKELQGQNLRHRSPSPIVPEQLHTFQNNSTKQTELNICSQRPGPTVELRGLVKEIISVIDEKQDSHCKLTARTISEESQKTRNEQGPLRTTDLDKREANAAFSANNEELRMKACYRSSSCVPALGRRSPVHSLLTSDLPTNGHDNLKAESASDTIQISSDFQKQLTGQTCKELQNKLSSLQNLVEDLQVKNKEMTSMIKVQEKRMKKVKDRGQSINR